MDDRKTVFLFAGQGSQYFRMAKSLFDSDATFHDWMRRLDRIVEDMAGCSVVEALYGGGRGLGDVFDRTILTHPAIFMVEYSLAQSLIGAGVRPDLTLGVSVGSFAAAAVAGFLSPEDALRGVLWQALALEGHCQPGGMIAVLADPALYNGSDLCRHSELAAVNFASHFVVSAPKSELAAIESELTRRSVIYQRLPVSFAFHSQWIDAARRAFEARLGSLRIDAGILPMMCCQRAGVLRALPDGYFWNVVSRPMRFPEAITELERAGTCRYIDVSPGGTLATLLKYVRPATPPELIRAIITPHGRELQMHADICAVRYPRRL